jgi:E3 ubiquitin-protein ligase MARCH6
MTRQVVRALRYTATFVKIVVLILFEFGIFPLGCGWWFDVCTLNIVGSTLSSRSSFCREFPWTCTAGHWFIGIFYMVHVSLFVSLLREVLQPQLLWFLRNPDDPEFHPFRELVEKPLSRHARRMCLSMLIYIPLIFAVVFVPGQLCLAVLPNVFPFNLADFSHSLVEVPFGNLLIVPLVSLVHHARPGSILRIFLRLWIQQVGGFLGIAHLVARDEFDEDDAQLDEQELDHMNDFNDDDRGSQEGDDDLDVFAPFEADRLDADEVEADGLVEGANAIEHSAREGNQVDVSSVSGEPEDIAGESIQTFDGDSLDAAPPYVSNVRGRAITMLFLAWSTLVVGECIALTLPTVLGRAIIRVVGLPSSHDLHSFGLGFYVHLAVLELAYRAHDFMSSVDAATLFRLALPYISIVMKGLLQWLLWFGLAPLASGLLVELTVTVPLRVSYMESPYFYLYQDWALGLLLIKVWSKIADAGGFGARWRERMERARDGGLLGAGRNFSRTFFEVVGPILFCSVLSLAIPYTFVHLLLPSLGFSLEVSSFIYRYLYVWLMCLYMTFVVGRYTRAGLCALHDSIRDDKYLVGRRLYNYS